MKERKLATYNSNQALGFKRYLPHKFSDWIILSLIGIDVLLLLLYSIHGLQARAVFTFHNIFDADSLSLQSNRGFAELFQYFKAFSIVSLLCGYMWKEKKVYSIYIVFACLFLWILFDDMTSLHTHMGYLLNSKYHIGTHASIRGYIWGEFIYILIIGIFFLSFGAVSYFRADYIRKKQANSYLILLGILAVFGVFIDLITSLVSMRSMLFCILVIIEDGGEMIVLSMITWISVCIFLTESVE